MTITCACGCGTRRIVADCRGGLRYVSRQHYYDHVRRQRQQVVSQCLAMGLNDRQGALQAGLSYVHYRRIAGSLRHG